jgi:Ran GTPase-activating protein (RanGAP) involved in mRNA processing and transport
MSDTGGEEPSDSEGFAHHSDNGGEITDDSNPLLARMITKLRTNDPSIRDLAIHQSVEDPSRLQIAKALTQNTVVRRITLHPYDYSKLSASAMAKYLLQSKRLLKVDLKGEALTLFGFLSGMTFGLRPERALCPFIATFVEAIGQSNSVQELSLMNLGLGNATESFEQMLTRTKTLRYLQVDLERQDPLEEAEKSAIFSGFSKNTTLRDIKLVDWQQTSLIPALTALQDHPVLEKLQVEGFSSFTGIDALLRGKNSQLKELIIWRFKGSTVEQMVCFEAFMLEMGRNTTILKMLIAHVPLSHENAQQLKAMLRRNTVLQDLNLTGDALGSTGFVEIASVLHRNTSIQGLDVSDNGLDDLVAANALRELLRRNKTITRLCVDKNAFGSNVAAVRGIADGFRANTTLQELDLSFCKLGNHGLSILAESLGQQKRGLVKLRLCGNLITCSGLRALMTNAAVALSTVTHLNLSGNSVLDEGASFLAEALRLQTLPSLTYLCLHNCGISDDGLVALMSALEENDTLYDLDLTDNAFSVRGYMALASSLPNIKGLRQISFRCNASDPSVMSAMLEGFRENTSLHEVNISVPVCGCGCAGLDEDWSQQITFFSHRNKFSRLLQDSDTDVRESLGLWSRALASVAMRPDVLFHVLTSKAGLIRAIPSEDCKKRKRDDSE